MGCAAGLCTAEKIFLFINVAFAAYSGALLATGARLAWDPSTYAWFRFLCAAQYRVSCAYVSAAGLWLLALVYLAAAAAGRRAPRAAHRCLHLYSGGVAALALSQVCYGAWMGASLAAWWRASPRAELARRALDLLRDVRPALLALERYRDLARPVLDIIDEVEREAPNNVYVILIFGAIGLVLQISAFVLSRRLARRRPAALALAEKPPCDEDSDGAECGAGPGPAPGAGPTPAGWRKQANLRMYTILDKIF